MIKDFQLTTERLTLVIQTIVHTYSSAILLGNKFLKCQYGNITMMFLSIAIFKKNQKN